jgi:hypothetical protein
MTDQEKVNDLICVLLLEDEWEPVQVECFSFDGRHTAQCLVRAILTVLSSFIGTDDMLLFFTKMSRELGAIKERSDFDRAEDGDSRSDLCEWSYQVYLKVTTVYQRHVDYWPMPEELDEEEGIIDIDIPLREITTKLEEGLFTLQLEWYKGIRVGVVLLLRKIGLEESYGLEAMIFEHCQRVRLSPGEALARLERFQ